MSDDTDSYVAKVEAAFPPTDSYVIWSNEHRAWWRPNSCGYTTSLASAGRYTRSEAIAIAAGSRGGWGPNRVPDEIALPLADAEEMLAKGTRA